MDNRRCAPVPPLPTFPAPPSPCKTKSPKYPSAAVRVGRGRVGGGGALVAPKPCDLSPPAPDAGGRGEGGAGTPLPSRPAGRSRVCQQRYAVGRSVGRLSGLYCAQARATVVCRALSPRARVTTACVQIRSLAFVAPQSHGAIDLLTHYLFVRLSHESILAGGMRAGSGLQCLVGWTSRKKLQTQAHGTHARAWGARFE